MLCRLLLTLIFLGAFAPGAAANAPLLLTLPIYTDSLASDWQNWSWGTTLNFNAADPVSGLPDRAISVQYTNNWGGLSLRHEAIPVTAYDTLRFAIHGGGVGGQIIQVLLQTSDGGGEQPPVALNQYLPPGGVPASAWAEVAIPLADLLADPAPSFARITWHNDSGGANAAFYLDDIRLTAPDPAPPQLTIHSAQGIRRLPTALYGSNAAYWNGNIHADPDLVAKVAASGITVLRYPGGSSSDEYHWAQWDPGAANNAWAMNTTEFVSLLQATNTQGLFTANFGSGSAAEAAAWVQFTNVTHNWNIRRWEIGNEIYGSWETSWTHDGTAYMQGDATHDGANAFCAAMKAVDPTIEVGIVGALNATEYNGWGLAVLSNASDCIDFYVIHYYALPPGNTSYQQLLQDPPSHWPAILAEVRTMLATYAPSRHLEIVADEYNAYYTEPEELQLQTVNLLFLADTLGQLIQGGVAAANQWDIVNGLSSNGGDYGLLLNWDSYRRTPGYFSFPLWRQMGDMLLALDNSANAATTFSAYAALANDGLTILAINKTDQALAATLNLQDFAPSGSGVAYVAAGASLSATSVSYNGNASPPVNLGSVPPLPVSGVASTFTYSFAPFSVTTLRLAGAPTCAWSDVDCDGATQLDDITALAGRWGSHEGDIGWNARFDHDADGALTVVDVQAAAAQWTP
ncbi:MAG: hypothetical protein IPM84_23670 [Anaerolineae bacterium]|nr:hypothetical protein [Anaerolineae bacterium]